MVVVRRTFDILEYCLANFSREDAVCGKRGNEWVKYSTEQYARNSELIAYGLLSLGLKKGDKIATVSGNRPEWTFVDMGIAMTGGVHVPIYPTISDDEYRYILNHSEARFLFVSDEKLYSRLCVLAEESDTIEKIFTFNEIEGATNISELYKAGEGYENRNKEVLDNLKRDIDEEDMATLIYTSGTTGTPKGAMLTHKNVVSNFVQHSNNHNLGIDHRALSFLPLCHILERSMNYHFQYRGIGVYYVESLAQIMPAIKEVKPHMFSAVPRVMERVYDGIIGKGKQLEGIKKKIFFWAVEVGARFEYKKNYRLLYRVKLAIADKLIFSKWREALGGNIEIIITGGAALQSRIGRVFGAAKIYALEGYGLTEASPVVAVANLITNEMKIGTSGPPLPNIELKIADDGEILVKGPSVMKGYYKEPELTKEAIDEDGWLHTGDVGVLEEGRYLRITDRKKEIFKLSGGKYIAPQMIENKFKESFLIEQIMVIGFNEKFASAIISPNFDYIHDWCSQHKIHFHNNHDLIENKQVLALIRDEVIEINKTLGQHEEIKRYRLIADSWTPQTGDLSQTLKLKRNILAEKYKDLIDEIFAPSRSGVSKLRIEN